MRYSRINVVKQDEITTEVTFGDLTIGDFFYLNNQLDSFGICRKIGADHRQDEGGARTLTTAMTVVVPVDVTLTWKPAEKRGEDARG